MQGKRLKLNIVITRDEQPTQLVVLLMQGLLEENSSNWKFLQMSQL
jgi:hypothetical protein